MNNKDATSNESAKVNEEKNDQELLRELGPLIKNHEIETNRNLIEVGNPEEAEAKLLQELGIRIKIYGLLHPYSMHVFNVLGRLYSDAKNFRGMVNLLRPLMETQIKALGPEDPNTLFTMNKLGRKLAVCEEHEEAEELFRKSLEGFEKLWGADHLITRRCRSDMKRLKEYSLINRKDS